MPSHMHKQVSLSTAVRKCEHETGNEKYIDFRIYSADVIIADEPPAQKLLVFSLLILPTQSLFIINRLE